MALLGNTSANHRNPFRQWGITAPGNERASWHQSGMTRNFSLHESRPTGGNRTGYPSGRQHPYSWSMPFKPGGMASVLNSQGVATVSGAMAAGINITGASDGVATTSGVGQLVVSGVGTANGVATVSGNLQAALVGTGAADGTSTASGTLQAKGWAAGTSDGVATVTGTLTATGKLIGSIAPAVELDAASFSTYLLDQEDVESGLSLRQALRLIAAATAGEVSGAGGTNITIRNAVGDSKDRIVATVDSNGNRTSITYDLD